MEMSVEKLKKYLSDNPEEIVKILEFTDFYSISFFDNKREIRCAYYEGGNHTSVAINCETLQTYVFSKGIGGDLFYIISLHNNWTVSQTIAIILKFLDIKDYLYSLKKCNFIIFEFKKVINERGISYGR